MVYAPQLGPVYATQLSVCIASETSLKWFW